jgi:hypothetical protein
MIVHGNHYSNPYLLFIFLYLSVLSVLLTNFTHISSFGAKINAVGTGVRELGVLSHFLNSNSDRMLTMQALFCTRPNLIPVTNIISFSFIYIPRK